MAQRILPRYLRQEILPPALLGLGVYTFILLMSLMFQVAELAIRRSLPLGLVVQIVSLAIPRVLVMTVPVAVLVGVMVGLSRLGSDGEIVGLRSVGVGDGRFYGAAGALGLIGWAVSSALLFWAVPGANYAQHRLTARSLALTDPAREIQPRVFYEKIPGTLLYAEEVPARDPLGRLFLYRAPREGTLEEEVTLARQARIAYSMGGDDLSVEVDLVDGASHAVDPLHPEGYRLTLFASQKVRLPPAPALAARLRLLSEPPPKGLREQSLPELWRTIREIDRLPSLQARRILGGEARMELHKQFSLPCASLVLALLGVPLGFMNRRGARAAGFAVSLGVIMGYWILMTVGEDLLRKGVLPSPHLAAWAPNLCFLGLGAILSLPRARRLLTLGGRATARFGLSLLESLTLQRAARARSGGTLPQLPEMHRRALRLVPLLDRLVASTFVRVLLLIGASAWVLYLLVEFKGQIDDLLKNRLPMLLLWRYLRFRSPALLVESVLPVSSMVAALLAFSHLSRTGELTAMQAGGVSRRRAAVPVLGLTAAFGLLSLITYETVIPASNQRAEEVRSEIRGRRSPRTFYRPEQRWVFGEQGRLYAYRRSLHEGRVLEGFTLLQIDREAFRLAQRWHAERAIWDGSAWRLERGWVRTFPSAGSEQFETFDSRREAFGEDPDFLAQEWQAPEQMNLAELRRYVRDLASGGYDVRELRVSLHQRLMRPWVGLVMVLVSLPFALRGGRQSPLAALGISLALVILYYALLNAGTKLGEVGVLGATTAVWGPSLLFAGAGGWMLARVRG